MMPAFLVALAEPGSPYCSAFAGVKTSGPAPRFWFHLSPQVGSIPMYRPSALAFATIQSTWAKYFSSGFAGSLSSSGRAP